MVMSCFRSAKDAGDDDLQAKPARPRPSPKKASTFLTLRRSGTDASDMTTASTRSNDSISKLPPCKRLSDAELGALMMPVPHVDRPSNSLRISNPERYSDLIYYMKASRGSRDWRSFDVFPKDEVDMNRSAVEHARTVAARHARKHCAQESFESETRRSIDDVDLIG